MEYPMATTTMTEKEWNYIMAPILTKGLPRAGIDQSYPWDIMDPLVFKVLAYFIHGILKNSHTCWYV
jgi:hypothetical protein